MSEPGRLIVCATPIGNLGDVSDRLRAALQEAEVVYAEDTRRTAKLMAHVRASAPLKSLFTGNEMERSSELRDDVMAGKVVALVSDAGVPTVSDPGAAAVDAVQRAGGRVEIVPGPSAVTTALAVSGLGADRFVFEGFLPRKGKERVARLDAIAQEDRTVVLFVAPHRLLADLGDLATGAGGDRRLMVGRELTKLNEELWWGTVEEAASRWSQLRPRGEFTLVLAPREPPVSDLAEAVQMARAYVERGDSLSVAARRAANETGASRREIYRSLLAAQDRI